MSKLKAQQIIAKVSDDLDLYHSDKYPILATFFDKNSSLNHYGIDHWLGGYDYSNPEAVGDKINFGQYPEFIITIDDAKEEAVKFGYYTGFYYIALKNGKYEILGRVGEMKRPW